MNHAPRILVVGTASLDVLHLPSGIVHTIGGAGMYTALAARHADGDVTLCAPRPQPMPNPFIDAAARLHWIGPQCTAEELPRLAIAHHGDGKATLLDAAWGAEEHFSPENLPHDLSTFDAVHVAALSSAQRMLAFVGACRDRGARFLSAGTYFRLVQHTPDVVREIMAACDAFFMNDNEARRLFGDVAAARAARGALLFVTCGADGARACDADDCSSVQAPAAAELDPTGAGDTFCGTALVARARGATPADAARAGCHAASDMIEAAGPQRLLAG